MHIDKNVKGLDFIFLQHTIFKHCRSIETSQNDWYDI